MSILPLLPSEANNSVIPVLEPYSVTFSDTYFEVFWNQNSLGDLIQPQLLRVHAYCCASSEDSQPKLRYYLEYFTKDRHNRYRLVAQGHARISEIFYLEWQDRYVFYTGNKIVCPDYTSPWDTRISQLEFENTIDRWVSLSDLVIGTKQSFLPFQVDFSGCDSLPETCKDGPGWYSQIIFNGDPLGDPVFLTQPTCVPFEGTQAAENVFGEFTDFIIDSIIDLAPSLISASKTINPFVGTVVSILFDALQDSVDVEMQFCPCPPGTDCVPGCGCLSPCPPGFLREGCNCIPDEDPPPDDIDLVLPLVTVNSPKKPVPDGPNNWYYDLPLKPMEAEQNNCICVLYDIKYTLSTREVTPKSRIAGYEADGNTPIFEYYYDIYPVWDTYSYTSFAYGELTAINLVGAEPFRNNILTGFQPIAACRGASGSISYCSDYGLYSLGPQQGTLTGHPRPPWPTTFPLAGQDFLFRKVVSCKVTRRDGLPMSLCGYPDIIVPPSNDDSCLDGTWYLVIELKSKRIPLPLNGKLRRIISVPGDKCQRPTIGPGEGGFYFVEPGHYLLNITLSTLIFYTPGLVDAYFFE